MKEQKALLIINPVSGTRSKQGLAHLVEEKLTFYGIKVVPKITKGSGDAFQMADNAARDGFDMVISAGGDGTVNEIANALSHSGLPMGIIPLGSGNGFARSLAIPQDVGEALKIIGEGKTINCDRGLVNDSPFYCTFGIGLDAAVSEKFAHVKKRGRVTYIRNVIREFLNYRSQPYAISADGKVLTEKALLIAVCNAQQYGNNAYIAPKAKLSDGLLDITIVHSGSPLVTMRMGVELMTGYIDKDTRIDSIQVKSAVITRLEAGPVHLDGEPRTMGRRMDIKCDPGALKVFAPENPPEFRPMVSPLRAMIDDVRYDMMARFQALELLKNIK